MNELIEFLAERQWGRMTRSSVPFAHLAEQDRRACRALVAPVAADLVEWAEQRGGEIHE